MSTSIEPFVALGEPSDLENLGLLHLAVERKHDRAAVLRRRVGTAWQDTPDWRFHRHAMRIGLYLRERGQLNAGDRVALVSALRPEWAVVQWAALTQGAATAAIDPALPDPELAAQLTALAPRAVFVEGGSVARVSECLAAVRRGTTIVGLDGVVPDGAQGQALSWSEALDLGGSLDTAERANAYRQQARELPPETPALGHTVGTNGSVTGVGWRFLSHREVVRRVQRVWTRSRIARGDVAYVTGGVPSLATSVALLAFTADGHTQIVIGASGNELEEIAMTRPHKVIAPAETVQRMLESPASAERSRLEKWLAKVHLPGFARFAPLATFAQFVPAALRGQGDGRGDAAIAASPAGRARWLSTGASLPLSIRAQARKFVTLEIDDSIG
jgi:acyl-CoA synthetase (AMP-forming)/AMP-acid ligase II